MQKNNEQSRITVRLDPVTDILLSSLAKRSHTSRAKAVKDAIKQAGTTTIIDSIADRLEQIEQRLSKTATTTQVEMLCQQFVALAETNNINTDRIEVHLNKLDTGFNSVTALIDKFGKANSDNAKVIWGGIQKLLDMKGSLNVKKLEEQW